ncbi:hypothetical protein PTSG_00830 [Salpingoeca rosetta]|uniref:Uncharacterized protein n=1 Tax=Salpingoeca rosetta (strain ATCC 50818 / BSB-021) TaxID=946362 RepID=F2TXL4_SALR5|nr:uncharacterized protein PTSG_00830 [Salpingoeca rosetta]EGD76123.1 hypothetical protein PTSG_00830 [Salpingoeca rosetta]|eukprot:XP_004998298.1 hypothetical protein PTSG_00830 [Salpingoeca rosetta]
MSQLRTKITQKVMLTLDSLQKGITDSNFSKTGKLTAKEFVEAGDFLVANFPSWSWAAGLAENKRSHLPDDKQFLISKNVPCFPREEREIQLDELKLDDDDDGWVQTSLVGAPEACGVVPDLEDDVPVKAQEELDDDAAEADLDDVPTLDDDDDLEGAYYKDAVEDDDEAALDPSGDADNIKKLRSYDISIHYDAHYSTPRVWLFGYDPDGKPLQGDAWKADFSPEHVDKTVTFERHPHLGYHCASIHPCKHAEGMKNTVELLVGDQGAVSAKFYMVIFLKFIQSVIPNIEYDYTSKFEVSPRQAD